MLTTEAKRKLTALGMFGLPVALVWVTGQMLGGPRSAEAVPTTAPPPAVPVGDAPRPPAATGDAAMAAKAHVAELRTLDFGPTPLYHAAAGESIEIFEDPEQKPPPDFEISAIMAARTGNTALIQGSAYHVGDRLGDTAWRIVEIDAVKRSVTIREVSSERTATRRVRVPGLPGRKP